MAIGRRDARKQPTCCPRCGSNELVPSVYGVPTPELGESARHGEVALGGRCVDDSSPESCCERCEHAWSLDDASPPRPARET
ncbi:MAG: hypothetical protein IT453_07390 [Planctomycetes bacterium]|nr:hypothetical protein [Planctomycetota bacterium]